MERVTRLELATSTLENKIADFIFKPPSGQFTVRSFSDSVGILGFV
jgi:hypothetical protein